MFSVIIYNLLQLLSDLSLDLDIEKSFFKREHKGKIGCLLDIVCFFCTVLLRSCIHIIFFGILFACLYTVGVYLIGTFLDVVSPVFFQYLLNIVADYIPKEGINDRIYVGVISSATVELYFLPYISAILKGHKNQQAIGILNLFLGWTYLFWVVALVWVFYKKEEVAEVPPKKLDSSTKS